MKHFVSYKNLNRHIGKYHVNDCNDSVFLRGEDKDVKSPDKFPRTSSRIAIRPSSEFQPSAPMERRSSPELTPSRTPLTCSSSRASSRASSDASSRASSRTSSDSSSRSFSPVVTPKGQAKKNTSFYPDFPSSLYPDLTSKKILYSVLSTPPLIDDECDLAINNINKMVSYKN